MFGNPDAALEDWLGRVNKGETKAVCALYHEDAVLLPTFSGQRFAKPAGRRSYFQHLATHGNLSVSLTRDSLLVQHLGGTLYCLSGLYDWKFDEGERHHEFASRFTFLMDLSRPDPILHHHSSRVPGASSP